MYVHTFNVVVNFINAIWGVRQFQQIQMCWGWKNEIRYKLHKKLSAFKVCKNIISQIRQYQFSANLDAADFWTFKQILAPILWVTERAVM